MPESPSYEKSDFTVKKSTVKPKTTADILSYVGDDTVVENVSMNVEGDKFANVIEEDNQSRIINKYSDDSDPKSDLHYKFARLKSSKLRMDFLATDTSKFDLETITRFLIALNQEINIVKVKLYAIFGDSGLKFDSTSHTGLKNMGTKLDTINNIYKNLTEKNGLSPESKNLMEKIQDSIQSLRELLEGKHFTSRAYEVLQNELTEMEIDDAIVNLDDILKNEPSMILVGINKYGQGKVPSLDGSMNDVKAVAKKIEKFKSSNKVELLDEAATKQGILNSIRNAPRNRPMFLYMVGHGFDGHFVPFADQNTKFLDKYDTPDFKKMISPIELFNAIGDRKAIVIVDNCFSGDLVMSAPDNITIVGASDSATVAKEDTNIGSFGISKKEDGSIIQNQIRWEDVIVDQGKATTGLVNNNNIPLDIRGFINAARREKHFKDINQQPMVNAGVKNNIGLYK